MGLTSFSDSIFAADFLAVVYSVDPDLRDFDPDPYFDLLDLDLGGFDLDLRDPDFDLDCRDSDLDLGDSDLGGFDSDLDRDFDPDLHDRHFAGPSYLRRLCFPGFAVLDFQAFVAVLLILHKLLKL